MLMVELYPLRSVPIASVQEGLQAGVQISQVLVERETDAVNKPDLEFWEI